MTQPWLSVILPSIGRPGLERALDSIERQPGIDREVIVVEDTLSGTQPHVKVLASRYGALYVGYAGEDHCWGHPQRNYGATVAKGRWLAWMADDDIYTRDAFDAIYREVERQERSGDPCPILFRVKMNQYGRLIWGAPGLAVGNIDAECIVTPNDPARLGTWALRYEGDFDFIKETVDLHGRCRWADPVIAIARPTDDEDWTR
jgi:hypothetical protein